MARAQRLWIATCLTLFCIVLPSSLLAQPLECTGKAAEANLPIFDPVYVDAMDLARYLIDHGFIVRCVQESKLWNMFEVQKGAALYVTDQGSFDVLFFPKAETLAALEIVEQKLATMKLYSFTGTPYPHSPSPIGGKKAYFIKSGNLLFLPWADAELAASIQAAARQ
jgi:hypothetical protein